MNIGFAENFNIEFTIHLKEGVKISKKLNFEKMNWALILNIGLCYQNLREYDMSMRYYEKALEISKKRNNPYDMCANYSNIGIICAEKSKLDKAIEYFKTAKNLAEKINYIHVYLLSSSKSGTCL